MVKLFNPTKAASRGKPSFEDLVRQAAQVESERRNLENADGNLSAAAYIETALAQPGADAKEVEVLEEAISRPENRMLLPSIRRLCNVIADFRRTNVLTKVRPYMDEEADAILSRLRCTRASLFVVAAQRMSASRPELFGKMKSPTEFADKHAALVHERDQIFSQIEQSWQRSDVVIEEITSEDRESGRSIITFRLAPGVTLDDGKDLGARIVHWLLEHEGDVARAA
jgi:hypothetical protein